MKKKEKRKPTAMSWLVKELRRLGYSFRCNKKTVRFALEMEKNQIMDAHWSGEFDQGSRTSKEYFESTYERTTKSTPSDAQLVQCDSGRHFN